MHYFLIQAKPKPGNEEAKGMAGAYVNCWIDFVLADGAELLARHYLDEYGWIPGRKEEESWVEEEDYKDDPEALRYYREAEEGGATFVFHNWPEGADDEEEEKEENPSSISGEGN